MTYHQRSLDQGEYESNLYPGQPNGNGSDRTFWNLERDEGFPCCHSTVLQRKRLDILSSRIHLFLPFPSIGYRYGSDRITGNWLISLIAVLLYLTRFIIKAIVFGKSARMLQQNPTTGWLFLLEFIQPIFNGYVRIYRLFRSRKDYTFRLEN